MAFAKKVWLTKLGCDDGFALATANLDRHNNQAK